MIDNQVYLISLTGKLKKIYLHGWLTPDWICLFLIEI